MSYPVVCISDDDFGEKIFIVPNKSSLLGFARTAKGDEEAKINHASEIFLSCIEEASVKEFDNGDYQIHVINSGNINKAISDFENKTLMSPEDYVMYMVMTPLKISEMNAEDFETIEQMVQITHSDEKVKPTFH